jgi:hypothetical protein
MSRFIRLAWGTAVLTFAAHGVYALTTPAAASNLSIATYYNSGSGFHSAWQSGGTGTGASPSSGYIIRLSAFYRDSTGAVWDLGQGAATASITFTVGGHSYTIGSAASCSCRSVQFAQPGIAASSSVSYSGVTLGTSSAYTLVMTVVSSSSSYYDANSPITASYQFGCSPCTTGPFPEQNQIVYPSAQSGIINVAVRLVNYTAAAASQDFLTYTGGSGSDTRTIYFKMPSDTHTYSATFSSSVSKVIVTLSQTDALPANSTGIIWWQTTPGDETVYAWFYPSSSTLN